MDADTVEQVHRVVGAVVDQGGAVGWLEAPPIEAIAEWLRGWQATADTGRGNLVLVAVDGRIEAVGGWKANAQGAVGHVVELTKIMVHPDARGRSLSAVVVEALIEQAARFGAELLVLGVRGNNHGAQALYERYGFTVWGVLPNGVAVGNDRFDDVRMFRQLSLPADAVRHGTAAGGVGGSIAR